MPLIVKHPKWGYLSVFGGNTAAGWSSDIDAAHLFKNKKDAMAIVKSLSSIASIKVMKFTPVRNPKKEKTYKEEERNNFASSVSKSVKRVFNR